MKLGGAGSYAGAANEMEQAVLTAPWLANAYFNLGIVQEKGDMFGQAIQNLRLYLLAAPQSPNAKAVQAKIYGLEVMREEQEKVQSLTIEGRKIRISGSSSSKLSNGGTLKIWRAFDFEKKGGSLEGSASISIESSNGCNFPNETVPVSGVIGGDGRPTRFEWKETTYQWAYQGNVCTGVSSLGKNKGIVELVERVTPGNREIKKSTAPATRGTKMMKKK